jgi:hypothetical protein
MVSQIPVVGILMIVNGSLATLLGLLFTFAGPLMFTMMQRDGPGMGQQEAQILTWMSIVYVVLGSAVALAGVLNIVGGVRALQFRNRNLVLTALFFNILPIFTCYCSPTSLGLMIYGLIVMFQTDVAHAFTLGDSGYSADEVRQRMLGAQSYRRERDQERRDDWESPEDRESRTPPKLPPADKPPPRPGDAGDEGIFEK